MLERKFEDVTLLDIQFGEMAWALYHQFVCWREGKRACGLISPKETVFMHTRAESRYGTAAALLRVGGTVDCLSLPSRNKQSPGIFDGL